MKTTLSHMISLIEQPLGEKASRNRDRLVRYANRIRQMFYNLYSEFEIEVDVTECFQLQCFRKCGLCPETYYGITLPAYMNAVEAVFINQTPINLYSKWREAKVGLKGRHECLTASYDQPGTYPTERDIAAENGSYLTVTCERPEDNGKSVEIVYVNPGGDQKREALQMTAGQPLATTDLAVEIRSVVLPSGLTGTVTLREACGRTLSEYMPYEQVPSYRRIKITAACPSGQIVVTANRQYQPVYWDTDIVETDNQEAIINAAAHLYYAESGADGGMIQKSEYHRNLMKSALRGEASRNLPVNRENDTGRFGPPIRRARLWTRIGGHNRVNIYRS